MNPVKDTLCFFSPSLFPTGLRVFSGWLLRIVILCIIACVDVCTQCAYVDQVCVCERDCILVYFCWPLCVSCYGLHKYRGHKGNPLPTTAQLLAKSHTTPEAYGIGFTTEMRCRRLKSVWVTLCYFACTQCPVGPQNTIFPEFLTFSKSWLFSSCLCGDIKHYVLPMAALHWLHTSGY